MLILNLIAAFGALGGVDAYLVTPAGTAFPGANSDCSEWVSGSSGLTCEEIYAEYNINQALFYYFNPELPQLSSTTCELLSAYYYCVNINYLPWSEYTWTTATRAASSSIRAPSTMVSSRLLSHTVASSMTTPSAASPSSAISTPYPIQTGMASTCDKFYLVVSGDTCADIASTYDITLANFYAWNPAVGSTCANLWVDDYVCVEVGKSSSTSSTPAATSTSKTSTTTTTTTSDEISTPSPIQTGMTSTCDEFYLVVSGDTCADIASTYDITLANFYAWNPAVGSSCGSLWVDDYVCVAVTTS